MRMFEPRPWFFAVAFICAALLAFALYLQHAMFVEPCPLCVLQRVGFVWIGLAALVAAAHNPGRTGRRVYASLLLLGVVAGGSVAGRHIWLQNLPPEQVPDCGMGLNYMLETMPFSEVFSEVFHGSGECAEIHWTLAGLSMPYWTLFWYIVIGLITLGVLVRARQ